jgi:hypothetical protein
LKKETGAAGKQMRGKLNWAKPRPGGEMMPW